MGLSWWRRQSGLAGPPRIKAFECGVRITQISGAGAGQAVEFPVEHNEILVGRDETWANFVLPKADCLASRRHLLIRRQADGEWEVVRQPDKYTDINGRPVSSRAKLNDEDEIALGNAKDGPKLRFELLQPSPGQLERLRSWISDKTTELQEKIPSTSELVTQLRRHVVLVAVCLAVAVVGGGFGLVKLFADIDELARITELLAQEEAQAREQPADWRDWAETLHAAAHVVVAKRGDLEWPVATAWPVSPTRMITNAHVVDELRGREDLKIVVRSPGRVTEWPIADMIPHPAHSVFNAFLRQKADRIGTRTPDGGFRHVRLPGAYDLAILELAPGSNAGPVLRPLLPEEAGNLRVGQRIAFAGYFLRGIEGGERAAEDAVPRVHFGEISARTNFFMRLADGDQGRLIHNTIPITGGTSGGPVIDERGRVIAVISSGTVVNVPKPGAAGEQKEANRVPSAALVNYAQRADLLHQFLDDLSSFDVAAEQAAYWEPELAGFDTFGEYILTQFLADVSNRDTRTFRAVREPVHMEVGRGFEVRKFALDLEAGRGYAIMAFSLSSEAVQLRLGDAGQEDHTNRGDPARLVFTARASRTVELDVLTSSREPTSFQLFIYRTE